MKKYNVIKNIVKKSLSEDDLILFYGDIVCKEAAEYDEDRFLYLRSGLNISTAIGLAMCTEKRLVIVCSDSDLMGNLDMFSQISLSKLKNIFCIILKSGEDEIVFQPSLSNNLLSIKGILFNMGFIVHDYSHFFKTVPKKDIKIYFDRIKGPMCVLIETSKGLSKNIKDVDLSIKDNVNRLRKFMKGE